ncbi:MAG: OsmC family protein [Promethearchaeota archaeon]
MSENSKDGHMDFEIDLKLKNPPFQFEVDFKLPDVDEFVVDEPPDIGGEGKGPSASRVLASAIGFCLSASLTFCLRKSRLEVKNIKTKVRGTIRRNKDGYWRIQSIQVEISPTLEPGTPQNKIDRCKEIFERYCIVTGSVRQGIPVEVRFV